MAEEREQVNKKPRTVLVTGFGPFNKHKVNSSWEAAKDLPERLIARGEEVVVVAKEIRVSYKEVKERIPALWEEIKPDLCIHVGLKANLLDINYEQFASNNGYSKIKDVDELLPESSTIHHKSPDKLETSLNLTELSQQVADIVAKGGDEMKIEVSQSPDGAGNFLCGYIYYTSLHLSKGLVTPVLFIHVPPLNKPYSQKQLTSMLQHTIETILNNHIPIGGQ